MYENIADYLIPWLEGKWAPPYRIHIFPTDLCNLRCLSCWRWAVSEDGNISWVNEEIPDERWFELIDEGYQLGVKEWELSGGGEPMVRKKLSIKLMEKIKRLGMKGEITTNFTLFSPDLLEFLIDIGWDGIIVSLDGPNPEINDSLRPPEGTFNKIYKNLKFLRERKKKRNSHNPFITIQCVLSKVNISAVKGMVDLAAEVEADNLTFEVIKKLSPRCEPLMLKDEDYKRAKDLIIEGCEEAKRKGVSTNLGAFLDTPEFVTYVGKMDEFFAEEYKDEGSHNFKFLNLVCFEPWTRLLISSIGTCAPCCLATYYQNENIKDKSLLEIWLSETFNNFRYKLLTKNFPQSCKQCHATLLGHSNLIRKKLERLLKEKSEIYATKGISIEGKASSTFKICLISREYPPETDWGGIGRYTYLLAKGLTQRGHEVHVITQTFQDEEYEYKEDGVFVHRIKHPQIFKARRPFEEFARRLEYSWRVYRKLLELIYKYRIEIVEGPNFSAECFVYSLFKKTPLITRIHTPYREVIKNFGWKLTSDRNLSCILEDILIKRSDIITCSTSIYANNIKGKYSLVSEKLKVIPLGIEIPELNFKQPNYSLSPRSLNILFVGRLEKRKGIHILFQAIPEVISKFKHIEFTIIGRDSFFQENEASFKSPEDKNFKTEFYDKLPSEIKEKVNLVGEVSREDLENYYKKCDLFVAPSLHETFGFVYLEAMSYGKPVIGCKVGGVPEVIEDGNTGFLVEPGDCSQLAEAIIKLLRDPKLRYKMGMNARRRVVEKFSGERMVTETEKFYERVINKK